jgi:hypothetical protein
MGCGGLTDLSSSITAKSCSVVLLACSLPFVGACHKSHSCFRDSDCPDNEVCFVDGCGDPGQGIRVEVSPQSSAGRFAQDLALDDIHARQDLQLSFPAVLEGSIKFQESEPPQVVPYSGRISVRGQGESEIIPGVTRTFDVTLALSQGGSADPAFSCPGGPGTVWCLPVNAGVYSITVNTLDLDKPPATTQTRTAVRPGLISTIDFLLGAFSPTYNVSGQITAPVDPATLDLQAFTDPISLHPLSQRVGANHRGEFTLYLAPSTLLIHNFVIQVSPHDATAPVPQKIFGPFSAIPNPPGLNLDMGSYGERVVVSGQIVDSHQSGISNATVYVDGRVGGGGTFRSQAVLTDSSGNFSLSTLRSAPDASSTFWAIPPTQSSSGILRLPLAIRSGGPMPLGAIACPDKVIVQGKIYNSDDSIASGVRVMATPINALGGLPLPANGSQDITDATSSYSLKLDPAVYRLDFIPGDQRPRVSRFATVAADPDPSGGFRLVQLDDVALSNGRRITGSVFAVVNLGDDHTQIAPSTSLRFFRLITDLDNRPSSVLLAETVSDGRGMYSVSLPSR